ncbi:MAG TPA: flavin reductase family protein [Longimicrobiales bacterium]|nr:flavin reductase family protein [Longimicrobiales bacterium]
MTRHPIDPGIRLHGDEEPHEPGATPHESSATPHESGAEPAEPGATPHEPGATPHGPGATPPTESGAEPAEPGVSRDAFREALSHWSSTVTIVAVREGARVYATTVTSFIPVSAEPPLVAISLGPNAQVLPWLQPGARFAVSLLGEDQRRLAAAHADSFPVGPSPFPDEGDPVVAGCVAALSCAVDAVHEAGGGARIVVARVEAVVEGTGGPPLLYHRRAYRRHAEE